MTSVTPTTYSAGPSPSLFTSDGTIYMVASSTPDTPAESAKSATATGAYTGDAVGWDPGRNGEVVLGGFVVLVGVMILL